MTVKICVKKLQEHFPFSATQVGWGLFKVFWLQFEGENCHNFMVNLTYFFTDFCINIWNFVAKDVYALFNNQVKKSAT